MYNYDFLCTYQLIDDDETLSNICYQQQLLQAFNLDQYDDKKIKESMGKIYYEICNFNEFITIFNKIQDDLKKITSLSENFQCDNFLIHNELQIVYLLFSYDYFHIFHRQYCLYKNKKNA